MPKCHNCNKEVSAEQIVADKCIFCNGTRQPKQQLHGMDLALGSISLPPQRVTRYEGAKINNRGFNKK